MYRSSKAVGALAVLVALAGCQDAREVTAPAAALRAPPTSNPMTRRPDGSPGSAAAGLTVVDREATWVMEQEHIGTPDYEGTAHVYTAGLTGMQTRVDFVAQRWEDNGPVGDLVVEIRNQDLTATLAHVIINSAAVTGGWISAVFDPGVPVQAGTNYALVFLAPSSPRCSSPPSEQCSFYGIGVGGPNSAGFKSCGIRWSNEWFCFPADYLAFRTYIELPTVTMNASTVVVAEGGTASNFGSYPIAAGAPMASVGTIRGTGGSWYWENPAPAGPATYAVDLSIGGKTVGSFTVNVTNVVPRVELINVQVHGDQTHASGEAVFIDPGADSWTETIDFGDGSPKLTFARNDGFADSELPDHTYLPGTYTLEACINDGDAGGCATKQLTVKPPTPPVITALVNGAAPSTGWYTGAVNLTWTVADPESEFSLEKNGCDAVSVITETKGTTITCSATSYGGASSSSVTIKRDATPPTLSFSGKVTYTVDQDVSINCRAVDLISDISSPCSAITGPAYSYKIGNNTESRSATNGAGLIGTASAQFTVTLTTDAMFPLITRFVSGKSLKTLTGRMENIADKVAKKSPALDEQVKNFLRELDDAQSVGEVKAADADVLARLVKLF